MMISRAFLFTSALMVSSCAEAYQPGRLPTYPPPTRTANTHTRQELLRTFVTVAGGSLLFGDSQIAAASGGATAGRYTYVPGSSSKPPQRVAPTL